MRKRKFPVGRVLLGAAVGAAAAVKIVNQISVKPAICFFRSVSDSVKELGHLDCYEKQADSVIEEETIVVSTAGCPDANLVMYRPEAAVEAGEKLPAILHIHGGGWCCGNAACMAPFVKLLASGGFAVFNSFYSFAPEHPYPVSSMQMAECLNYLYEHAQELRIDRERIFLVGHSSGAHLASQLAAAAADCQYAQETGICIRVPLSSIRGVLLLNGVFNLRTAGDCTPVVMKKVLWAYTGQKDYLNCEKLDEISTTGHISPEYPPVFLVAGTTDSLRGQSYEMGEALDEAGVEAEKLFWEGSSAKLTHDFVYDFRIPEAKEVYERADAFMKKHC